MVINRSNDTVVFPITKTKDGAQINTAVKSIRNICCWGNEKLHRICVLD